LRKHKAYRQVLLFGIVLALVARTGFIFIGAALITIFDWAFYIFGIVLLIMAANLAKRSEAERAGADTVITCLCVEAQPTAPT
jgi:tellurite resistance protein TerC